MIRVLRKYFSLGILAVHLSVQAAPSKTVIECWQSTTRYSYELVVTEVDTNSYIATFNKSFKLTHDSTPESITVNEVSEGPDNVYRSKYGSFSLNLGNQTSSKPEWESARLVIFESGLDFRCSRPAIE